MSADFDLQHFGDPSEPGAPGHKDWVAEQVVAAQRERGRESGAAWARTLPKPPTRLEAINESDRRYPVDHPDYILMHNLSGGFIDGAAESGG